MTVKRFLSCLIKFVSTFPPERAKNDVLLVGIGLFRRRCKTFSKSSEAGGISMLEPFDSQIVSIISSDSGGI